MKLQVEEVCIEFQFVSFLHTVIYILLLFVFDFVIQYYFLYAETLSSVDIESLEQTRAKKLLENEETRSFLFLFFSHVGQDLNSKMSGGAYEYDTQGQVSFNHFP